MAEYIEREAVLALKKPFPTSKDSITLYQQYFISPTTVENIPAPDVVPVVRCGECRFWNRDRISVEGLARCNTGETGIRYRTKNDFCSRGMRMDGDGE